MLHVLEHRRIYLTSWVLLFHRHRTQRIWQWKYQTHQYSKGGGQYSQIRI